MPEALVTVKPPEPFKKVLINTDSLKTLSVQSLADARYQLVIDGVVYTGQKTIHGKAIRLDRRAHALVLLVDDRTVPALELAAFFDDHSNARIYYAPEPSDASPDADPSASTHALSEGSVSTPVDTPLAPGPQGLQAFSAPQDLSTVQQVKVAKWQLQQRTPMVWRSLT